MTDEHRVRRLQSRKIVTKTQWSNKDIFICPIREITVEEEHRGFVISKTKPEILQDLSRYGTKKHISESVLYIILTFALINIVIVAALWTVYSARGKAPERIYVQCMDDWVLYRGKCYYFSDQIHTWKNSQNFCKSNNSSLAIIDNEKEMITRFWSHLFMTSTHGTRERARKSTHGTREREEKNTPGRRASPAGSISEIAASFLRS
ncbi:uncharacterized protein [Aquarana catesbeiana]|uniref:uncharacterized protein isoform X2 n=1 Tax=Aquarana catesbeiana TaxID=8400 RepID=UPI003CC9A375